ncbi:MAG: M24 family metallopeptidase [Mycobacteriales bacterium]
MTRLGSEKSRQARDLLQPGELWLFLTQEGSDPAVRLVFDAGVSGAAAFLLTPEHGALALVANYDEGHVSRLDVFDAVRSYERSFTEGLQGWLRELAPTSVLVNYSQTDHLCDGLSHGQFLTVRSVVAAALGAAPLRSSQEPLTRVRGAKSAEERRRLRTAIDGSVELYDRLRETLAAGQSEREIQARMVGIAGDLGLQPDLGDYGGPLVLINRVGLAHRGPGEDRLQPGDILVLDHGLACDGYYSDVARTIYLRRTGEDTAPDDTQRAFRSAYEAISAAYQAIRPGRLGWEVDAAARQVHLANGYPEISHATGHQIGRAVHDGGAMLAPRWERYGDGPDLALEEHQVFTLEPTILQSPAPSMLIEENVEVTAGGARWLTRRQDELWCV